ncbi:helix-turn-helix transcriptional regulator [Yersinia sp. 1252 StPb PI]
MSAGDHEFVASTRINRYEKGVHEASMEVAQQLADVLQIPLAYFYTADDVLADMMLAFMALSPEEKTMVLALAKLSIAAAIKLKILLPMIVQWFIPALKVS